MGGGGPRDRQRRVADDRLVDRLKPAIHAEVTKNGVGTPLDISQYLPLDIVRRKIEEAVEATKQAERKRYNSGLRNINDQLNAAKKQKAAIEDKLIATNAEIKRLKSQISKDPLISEDIKHKIRGKNTEILQLKNALSGKDKEISDLRLKTSEEMHSKELTIAKLESNLESKKSSDEKSEQLLYNLQDKLEELYNRIADGSIQPLVGSNMDRPELEDKIFIDPIDKEAEPKLDSHIDIKEEKLKEENRDMKTDLAKLRKLLNM